MNVTLVLAHKKQRNDLTNLFVKITISFLQCISCNSTYLNLPMFSFILVAVSINDSHSLRPFLCYVANYSFFNADSYHILGIFLDRADMLKTLFQRHARVFLVPRLVIASILLRIYTIYTDSYIVGNKFHVHTVIPVTYLVYT